MMRSRRRPRWCGPHACALAAAVLLLISVSLLHTRLSLNDAVSSTSSNHHFDYDLDQNPLLSDTDDGSGAGTDTSSESDRIDELDVVNVSSDDDLSSPSEDDQDARPSRVYYVDHVTGVIRRALNKRSIEEWDYDSGGAASFGAGGRGKEEGSGAFGSDDVPIDEEVRGKIGLVKGIEDAMLLKVAGGRLRDGWGDWFEKKSEFLRRDRMFRSGFESLNPLNNPLLQDPDGTGGLSRGDKRMQKLLMAQMRGAPPLGVKGMVRGGVETQGMSLGKRRLDNVVVRKVGEKPEEVGMGRSTLDNVVVIKSGERDVDVDLDNGREMENVASMGRGKVKGVSLGSTRLGNLVVKEGGETGSMRLGNLQVKRGEEGGKTGNMVKKGGGKVKLVSEENKHVYADGRRWGYFPGLDPRLSFSEFVRSFFKRQKCEMRVFMVWNSPPWMYGVRQRRGIESLLSMHRDACVIVLSETLELDFFKDSFVKAGYKVAVAMPNLDELLKDTPTHVFSSVWFQWRKTKFYPIHYSELVRLAVLYKYGGIYLDSDIIVLNPLSLPNDTVGLADQADALSLNGAVMSFKKHSPFILECLKEFYSTYDDCNLTSNGADLLTRVASKMSDKGPFKRLGIKVQPSFVFFPISSKDITRYFTSPATETEGIHQDAMFEKIITESLTFHFWNSLTSSLVPEQDSIVARLIDHSCIYCHDLL